MEKFQHFRIDEFIAVQAMNEVHLGQRKFLNSSATKSE